MPKVTKPNLPASAARALPAVTLMRFQPEQAAAFVALAKASAGLHKPWVSPPTTELKAAELARRRQGPNDHGFIVVSAASGQWAGYIGVSNIVRGAFHSAYLGYYAFAGAQGQGWMTSGLAQVLKWAKREEKLHRLEANIQPENQKSIALVQRLGFQLEGYSPRYLKIGGRWRDHERWARELEG